MSDVTDQDLEQWNYWVVFWSRKPVLNEAYAMINTDGVHIYHMVGFEEKPDENDIREVTEEVRSDPSFGLGDVVDELAIRIVSKELGCYFLGHSIKSLSENDVKITFSS